MSEMPRILQMDEEIEYKPFERLEDGLYRFKYKAIVDGNHEPDQYDGWSYPIKTASLDVMNVLTGEQGEHKERFKMLDSRYNVNKIASFFMSLGCQPDPQTKRVRMAWNGAIGREGVLEVVTREMKDKDENGNPKTFAMVNFILPEKVEEKKVEWAKKANQTAQAQPVQPVQPTQAQPTNSWNNSGNQGW